ncbi:MAG: hypothetical protein QOF51_1126 [Chloroflexota bacterium]|jgi:divalent metal cation (Fe/Co/Zn/Cd) transporter|nr:hypothetical protein [Chloroflexota bacterium]
MVAAECMPGCQPCHDCCACDDGAAASAALGRWRNLAWWLTAATIAWNGLEAGVALISGWVARSIALLGFGLDSLVEVSSALVIAWRLSRPDGDDEEATERIERRAVRLIAVSFIGLAVYVVADSASALLRLGDEPERSGVGLALVIASLIVMPALFWAKRHVAQKLSSVALHADAGQTKLCTYLSGVVLLGLAANALFGWWWMDPLAALVIAAVAFREGYETWQSGDLCSVLESSAAFDCSPLCCVSCPTAA